MVTKKINLLLTPEEAILLRRAIASSIVTMHEYNQRPWASVIQKLDDIYKQALFETQGEQDEDVRPVP
jgi:hypothetical protein